MNIDSLTPEQKEIVTSTSKYIRVIAGPGTGKTETLTQRILYLLFNHGAIPSSIVAFTFTEKAAQSLKSRIYSRTQEIAPNSPLLQNLCNLFIGTIHSFCLKILKNYFNYGNYSTLDENQEFAFVSSFYSDLKLSELAKKKYPNSNFKPFEIIGNFIRSANVIYDNLIDLNTLKLTDPDFYEVFTIYEHLLDSHKLLTFSRMVYLTTLKIQENPSSISGIEYLLVDEYQDINPSQEKLIELIGKTASVFIVGDPRQTIYQWRGSDESCFFRFPQKFPSAESYSLTINHRSTASIIQIANQFSNTSQYLNNYPPISTTKESSIQSVFKLTFNDPEEEASWIVNTIKNYVQNYNGNYRDCAVLYRSVYLSATPLINILREHHIPYIVAGKVSLFQRPEIEALAYIFTWLAPNGFFLLKNNKYLKNEKLIESALKIWETYITPLSPLTDKYLTKIKNDVNKNLFRDLAHLLYEILNVLNYKQLDPTSPDHHIIIANIGRFASLLSDFEFPQRLGGKPINFPQMLENLCYFLNFYASSAYEESQLESLSTLDAVNILTIHQSKGLEWPIVFIPSLQENLFPSSRIGENPNWLVNQSLFNSSRYLTTYKSESQLFYVALTRAKDFLFISYCHYDSSGRIQKRSSLLDNIITYLNPIETFLPSNFTFISHTPPQNDIPVIAITDLIDYLKCPYFFLLRKIFNYPSGFSYMLGYGDSLHYCLHLSTRLINESGYEPEKAVTEAIEKEFYLPFASNIQKMKIAEGAKKALLNFVSHPESKIDKIINTEFPLELLLFLDNNSKTILSGIADVILSDETGTEIRDYKTSSKVTPAHLAALQLQVYAYILQAQGDEISKASIIYLEEPEPNNFKQVNIEPNELNNAINLIKKTSEKILNKDYPAQPENGHCPNCDYKIICKFAKSY